MTISLCVLEQNWSEKCLDPQPGVCGRTQIENILWDLAPEWRFFSQSAWLPSSPGWHLCAHYSDVSCCTMSIVSDSVSTIWDCLQRRCDRGSSVSVGAWLVSRFPDCVSSSSITSSPPPKSPTCCDHGRVRVASAVTTVEWEWHLRIPTTSLVQYTYHLENL